MNQTLNFDPWVQAGLLRVEQALGNWISSSAPAGLGHSMRYAVLDGGKRLRPLLVLAAHQAVAGPPGQLNSANFEEAALRAACAVELIHAYSLVHDDMPCMDNDQLRRGKPTVHVQFGQAQALLTGDALQALAFEVLTPSDSLVSEALQARLCGLLARAAGYEGMAGGQAIDLASVGLSLDEASLRDMHRRKTGALLEASVRMGALCGAQSSAATEVHMRQYGQAIGLAFQVVDDILDVTADSATLGNTAGKDAASDKPTFVSVWGLSRSQEYARQLLEIALDSLSKSQLANTEPLRFLAEMVVNRSH